MYVNWNGKQSVVTVHLSAFLYLNFYIKVTDTNVTYRYVIE